MWKRFAEAGVAVPHTYFTAGAERAGPLDLEGIRDAIAEAKVVDPSKLPSERGGDEEEREEMAASGAGAAGGGGGGVAVGGTGVGAGFWTGCSVAWGGTGVAVGTPYRDAGRLHE